MTPDLDYNELDANIRRVVALLRTHGFDTTDSGDGTKHPAMECAMPIPNVFSITDHVNVIDEANRLYHLILDTIGAPKATHTGPSWSVEASYSPTDGGAIVALYGVSDDMLPPPVVKSPEEYANAVEVHKVWDESKYARVCTLFADAMRYARLATIEECARVVESHALALPREQEDVAMAITRVVYEAANHIRTLAEAPSKDCK